MKREVLFKAQRADGKGWVEGYLLWNNGNPIIVLQVKTEYISKTFVSEPNVGSGHHWAISTPAYKVKPETLCQFTGLTDKNGNKIFEGDKINMIFKDYADPLSGVICWDKDGFVLEVDYDACRLGLIGFNIKGYEIIGNIHDKTESK